MEKCIPQDPFELNPKDHLKSKFIVGVPDLRSENRDIQLLLKLRPGIEPDHYVLKIRPTSDKHLPLNLNLLVSDSTTTSPQFPILAEARDQLLLTVTIRKDACVRVWINCL